MTAAVPHWASPPLWWRLPAWTAIVVATVLSAHQTPHRIAAAVLMVIGAGLLQFIARPSSPRIVAVMVIAVSAAGLGATLVAPSGLAPIVIFIIVSRFPYSFDHPVGRAFIIVDTIAVAVVIGWVSHGVAGALAGVGVPLLAQRAAEHRELIVERDRARALLAEVQAGRDAETQAAALRERGRIARDMHDVLAHSLAGLSLQLQAVRALAAREGVGPVLLEPLDRAAALASDGLAEAREAVGTLRDPVGLGLDAVPALVERHPGSVTLTTSGVAGEVAPDAGHALYRVVQESLTNSARYAPGSATRVELAWHDDRLLVRIDDDGPAPGRTAITGQGSGFGLAGMQERLGKVAGTLTAGPRPDGGWRVEACVPVVSP